MSSSPVTLEGGAVRAVFTRAGDRWRHVIEALVDGKWRAALESVEGAADDDWPPSPPLQTLETMDAPGAGRALMLLGMAGSSLWSVVVTADALAGRLLFDCSCRCSTRPRRLGAEYRPLALAQSVRLSVANSPDVERAEVTHGSDGQLCVSIAPPGITEPRTMRWQYATT